MKKLCKEKLVSILMPAFNVEGYISEAIVSIQQQTYQNWELIVIDDGSTDRTLNIINKFSEYDNRIKVYKNELNMNIVKTLNKGLNYCSGHFILRVDSDDIIGSERIEKLVTFLNNNKHLKIVGSSMTSIDSTGKIIGQTKFAGSFECIKKISKYGSPICHIWMTYPEVYKSLQGYRELAGVEDYDFILRAIDAGYLCANLSDDYSYFVRLGRDGNTASTLGLKQLKLKKYAWKLHSKRLNDDSGFFTEKDKNKNIESMFILEKLHLYSNKLLLKGISNKSLLLKIFYILSSFISPYQVRYIFERVCIKLIILKENK